mmetsp:Transcript_16678/g.14559  ORF Transcript_16678/g.14559 Transcript_16678/m.14559 type:complete len:150 (+) Transcript_16678:1140-1589(+)
MIAMLGWFFNRGNYKLSIKEFFILSFAGLRGTVSVTMAVTFTREALFEAGGEKARSGELVVFLCGGTVFLNYLIDDVIARWVINKVKLQKRPISRDVIFKSIIKDIGKETENHYQSIQRENPNAAYDWEELKKFVSVGKDDNKLLKQVF